MSVKVFDGIGTLVRGDVLLCIWKADARLPRIQHVFRELNQLLATHSDVLLIQMILPSSGPPDSDSRDRNRRELKRLKDQIRRFVSVPVGDALRMSLVRTIMRAMTLVSGTSAQHLVDRTIAIGVDHLLEKASPSTPSRRELLDSAASLFVALDEKPPAELQL